MAMVVVFRAHERNSPLSRSRPVREVESCAGMFSLIQLTGQHAKRALETGSTHRVSRDVQFLSYFPQFLFLGAAGPSGKAFKT